jgi:TatA/E family protein of Tat protein translocase
MGPLGIPELIFIFVLALLIFGPKKLPELGRTFGKSMAEFRRASNDLRNTFQREMDTIDRENQDLKDVAQEVQQDLNTATDYEDSPDDYYSNSESNPVTETSGASSDLSSSETVPSQKREANATDSPTKASNGNEAPSGSPSSDALKSTDAPDAKPGS